MANNNSSWPSSVFDQLYARDPDPWKFTSSAYEREKYAATLAALPAPRFGHAFEIGCSIGVLTRQLAQRCDAVLAVDVAQQALDAARRECAGLDHVQFRQLRVPEEWPEQRFDLIILSEVLYFLSPDDVAGTARHAVASLQPNGAVLLVNWTGTTNSPCTGDEAAESFLAAAADRLTPTLQQRQPRYRLDLLRPAR